MTFFEAFLDEMDKLGAKDQAIPRSRALSMAKKGLRRLEPHIEYGEVVGRIPRWAGTPRQHPSTRDIDLLVLPRKGVKLPSLPRPYEVFTADRKSFEPTLVHWLSGKAIVHLKRSAREKGWKLNRYGLSKPGERTIRDANKIFEVTGYEMPPHIQSAVTRWRQHRRQA